MDDPRSVFLDSIELSKLEIQEFSGFIFFCGGPISDVLSVCNAMSPGYNLEASRIQGRPGPRTTRRGRDRSLTALAARHEMS